MAGALDAAALREIEDAAIRDVVRMQEDVGFTIVTDGEFRRENWYSHFVERIAGVFITAGLGPAFAQRSAQPKHVPKQVQTVGKVLRAATDRA